MKISDHISYKEGIRSSTATRLGIDNSPSGYHRSNMEVLAERIFEPLRKYVGGPIRINSFYRCDELNEAIGGASKIIDGKKRQTSQHCEGRAMDIDDTHGYKTNAEMYQFIKDTLDFDQLIWEFGDENNPDWIHVSYVSEDSNRNRCLKAYKDKNKKTRYMVI
jgi:hypothetical protein